MTRSYSNAHSGSRTRRRARSSHRATGSSIASHSKSFTAAGILKLWEQKKLRSTMRRQVRDRPSQADRRSDGSTGAVAHGRYRPRWSRRWLLLRALPSRPPNSFFARTSAAAGDRCQYAFRKLSPPARLDRPVDRSRPAGAGTALDQAGDHRRRRPDGGSSRLAAFAARSLRARPHSQAPHRTASRHPRRRTAGCAGAGRRLCQHRQRPCALLRPACAGCETQRAVGRKSA